MPTITPPRSGSPSRKLDHPQPSEKSEQTSFNLQEIRTQLQRAYELQKDGHSEGLRTIYDGVLNQIFDFAANDQTEHAIEIINAIKTLVLHCQKEEKFDDVMYICKHLDHAAFTLGESGKIELVKDIYDFVNNNSPFYSSNISDQYRLAVLCEKTDIALAFTLFSAAAQQKNRNALFWMYTTFRDGNEQLCLPKTPEMADDYLKQAAKFKHPEASELYGDILQDRFDQDYAGSHRDLLKAVDFYHIAFCANKSNTEIKSKYVTALTKALEFKKTGKEALALGQAYLDGTLIEQDTSKGWEWITTASEAGNREAFLMLANHHAQRTLVDADLISTYFLELCISLCSDTLLINNGKVGSANMFGDGLALSRIGTLFKKTLQHFWRAESKENDKNVPSKRIQFLLEFVKKAVAGTNATSSTDNFFSFRDSPITDKQHWDNIVELATICKKFDETFSYGLMNRIADKHQPSAFALGEIHRDKFSDSCAGGIFNWPKLKHRDDAMAYFQKVIDIQPETKLTLDARIELDKLVNWNVNSDDHL